MEVKAVCTADGSQYRKCKKCGIKDTEFIPEKGHDYSEDGTVKKQAVQRKTGKRMYAKNAVIRSIV